MDSIDDFLRRSRGQGPADDYGDDGLTGISSIDDLRGTVFDDSDPIAQWRRTTGPAPKPLGLGGRIMGAVGAGAAKVTQALNYPLLGKPLDWLKEKAFASADEGEDQPEALRTLKRYGGAVAETAKGLSSPLGIASFLSGGTGMVARGVLGSEQVASGVPETYRGVRDRDWKQAGQGALETGLGALMLSEPVGALAREAPRAKPADWTPQSTEIRRGKLTRLDQQPDEWRPVQGLLGPASIEGRTPGQLGPGDAGGPMDAEFDDLTKLLEGGTGADPDFYGNPAGELTRTMEAGQQQPRALLPERGTVGEPFGVPARESYTPENSNRALTPDEFLARARMTPGDPLAELETSLSPSPAADPYAQDPLAGFDVEFGGPRPTMEPANGRRIQPAAPGAIEPDAVGQGAPPESRGLDTGEAGGVDELDAYLNARYGEDTALPGNGTYGGPAPGESAGRGLDQLAAADQGGLVEGRSDAAGPADRGLDTADDGIVFQRRPPEENAARLTPEVRRELAHMDEELSTFPFQERTFNARPEDAGYDIVPGGAGSPIYDDVLGEALTNRRNNGQGATKVRGSRGDVSKAIRRVLETGDIHNNIGDGAVRLAEKWLEADKAGQRAGGWLPRTWAPGANDLPANMPDELSALIDEWAAKPDGLAELEKTLSDDPSFADTLANFGGNGHPESPEYVGKVLAKAGPGAPGLSIEPLTGNNVADLNTQHVVYRGPDGQPIAVAKVAQDMNGKNLVMDLAADKTRGLLTGRAMKAIGDQLESMGATEAAGTMSPDAQNFLARRQAKAAPDPIAELGDVLDTGETQSRLPEAGAVRDQNVATPQLEAPFSLSAPKNDALDALDGALNFNEPKPTAVYRGFQPNELDGGGWALYDIQGGPHDRSTVTAQKLQELGIDVPDTPAPPAAGAPKPVPDNVRAFLTKQLKYTSDQVDAMGFDDAIRIGRERVPNPDPPAAPPQASIEAIPEQSDYPDMEGFDERRRARGLQRRSDVEATAVPPREPAAVENAPPPKTPADRQAAGETLTARERESLNLPAEERARSRTSLRDQGVSPRQIDKRVKQLDSWMDDPTPENFARWVQEVTGQAERVNERAFKGGTGEGLPPRSESGEVLYSGFDPSLLFDGRFQQHLRDFFVGDDIGNLWARRLVASGVGAALDPDNRAEGALAGFLAATYGPRMAKLLAGDVVQTMQKGWGWWEKEHGALAQPYDRTPRTGDIGVIERGLGSKAHTIPEEFAAVRPGVEAFQNVKETGKVDSRLPLLADRGNPEAGPAYKGGKLQIRQSEFLKPEITYLREQAKKAGKDRPRLASYLTAYADELAGAMTRSEQLLADAGIKPKAGGRAASEVANQVYRSGLAFNPGSAAVNRISQPLLAAPYTGLKNLWKAYAPLNESEKGLSKITRPVDISDVQRPALKVLDTFDNFASTMMRVTDNQNRQGVYAAAHRAASQSGADAAAAHKFARDVSEKTQGLLGLLSGNPSWRGPIIKTVKPFTKYPILFAEWLNDVATATDPRVRWRTAAMAGAVLAFSKGTGIDVFDMLAGGARYGGSTILRAAMDVYNHATNQVKDHEILTMPGKGFTDSDVGNIVYPVGVRKAVDTAKRFAHSGLDTHTKRTPGGAREDVSPLEDLANLFGVQTTRQTDRRKVLNDAHASETRAAAEDAQASAQAKRDFYAALDSGDSEGVQQALAKMGTNTRKSVLKGANRDRFDRLLHTTPRSRRPQLRDRYGELEKALELP